MNEASITLGSRSFKVLSESDTYGHHLSQAYIDDSANLRNFLYTHYDSGSDYKIADIGANIGYTSRIINELLPEALIHSFEPSPEVYAILQDNTIIYDNIVAINKAIASQESFISFASNSAYGHIVQDGHQSSCKVHCTDLSSFAALEKINKYDFVKVDVEGFELDVFKGIGSIADVVFFEFNPWAICHNYKGNPLEVIREIMDEWMIFRFASKTKLEQVENADTLAHDTIVYKPYDDFVALRKKISNKVTIKTRLKRHVLRDELIGFMYKGILGRNAESGGVNHFMSKYKDLSDTDFVSSIYLDLVNSEEFNSSSY